MAVAAAPASAFEPAKPSLSGTNPPSPSTATRPLIQGVSNGVITAVLGPRALRFGPITRVGTSHPEFLITIFAEDDTCADAGSIAAEGTAAELEGAGIQVDEPVQLDHVTTFYAKQTDPADPTHPSGCSTGLDYRQVTTPPGPPILLGSDPASPADENFPNLTGTAAKDSIVSIYKGESCSGEVVASGPAATFDEQGIEVTVADNTTTAFWAKATLAGLSSGCSSSSLSYQEKTETGSGGENEQPGGEQPGGGGSGGEQPGTGQPPAQEAPRVNPPGNPAQPKLHAVPGGPANDNTPAITGKAPGAYTVKIYGSAGCTGTPLASGPVAQFEGPGLPIEVADNTTTNLYGISVDGGGDRSGCTPDAVVYVEDSTAPHALITLGPGAKTRHKQVLFKFTDVSGDPSATFSCKLDKRAWKPCKAPLKLRKLGHKRHVLTIRSVDSAGNQDPKPAKRSFKVIR